MEYYEEICISIDYKYNGKYYNELGITQTATELEDHQIVLINGSGEEMFRTKDFYEFAQFLKDLKAGKYVNGKEE